MRSSAMRFARRRAGSEIRASSRICAPRVAAAVQGEPTVQSQVRAEQLIGAIDNGAVVATARTVLDNFEANAPLMTPERIGAAMRGAVRPARARACWW